MKEYFIYDDSSLVLYADSIEELINEGYDALELFKDKIYELPEELVKNLEETREAFRSAQNAIRNYIKEN